MKLTLLFDLDDTLLGTNMDSFQVAYLKSLGAHLASYIPPDRMIKELMKSTEKMIRNQLPDLTLEQVFDASFYPSLGVIRSDIQKEIDEFYQEIFPTLRSVTHQRPEAVNIIKTAFEHGHRIAIATSPLFPRVATLQRVEWAGLSLDAFPFDIVTTYEDFHFAKPNPAYYAELLARLGWQPEPVLMVGNDPESDIDAAAKMGIPTYWLRDSDLQYPANLLLPTWQGTMQDLKGFLENPSSIPPMKSSHTQDYYILLSTPATILTFSSNLLSDQWKSHPVSGEWGLTEIFCHLADVETEVNLPRLQRILYEDNPFLPGIDTDAWAVQRNYAECDGIEAVHRFVDARKKTLNVLAGLSSQDWHRKATHAIFGPTHLAELVNFIGTHDRSHIHDIWEILQSGF